MLTRAIATTFVLTALPMMASAATTEYFDKSAFDAIVGSDVVIERFDVADQQISAAGTVFRTGVTVSAQLPSADNKVADEVLNISLDNSGNPAVPGNPLTSLVTITLPYASTFFGITFGVDGSGGIGNNSGTTLSNGETFRFSRPNPGYTGFYGLISDMAFQTVTFRSNDTGTFTDDDIKADDLIYAATAPVPVPAGLPLLVGGLAAFGFARSRKKNV